MLEAVGVNQPLFVDLEPESVEFLLDFPVFSRFFLQDFL